MARNAGGIWKKEKNGKEYLSISIEIGGVKKSFVAFKNDYKQAGDNKPDYSIMPPKEDSNGGQSQPEPMPEPEVGEGEIPF